MSRTSYPRGITRMDDYIFRRVILRQDMSTKGGRKFEAGEVLMVCGHHRGRLTLEGSDGKTAIRGVLRNQVWLLPQD